MSIIDEKVLRVLAYQNFGQVIKGLNQAGESFINETDIRLQIPRSNLFRSCHITSASQSDLLSRIFGPQRDLLKRIYGPVQSSTMLAKIQYLLISGAISSINAQKYVEVLRLRKEEFEESIKKSWSALLAFRNILTGNSGLVSDFDLGLLTETNAIIPYFDESFTYFMVNVKALEFYQRFIESLTESIKNRFSNIDNLEVVPFIAGYKASKAEQIILTFYAEKMHIWSLVRQGRKEVPAEGDDYDITEEVLKENVVIIIPPSMLGYEIMEGDKKFNEEENEYESYDSIGRKIYSCKVEPLGKYDRAVEFNAGLKVDNIDLVEKELGKYGIYSVNEAEYEPLAEAIKFLKQKQ